MLPGPAPSRALSSSRAEAALRSYFIPCSSYHRRNQQRIAQNREDVRVTPDHTVKSTFSIATSRQQQKRQQPQLHLAEAEKLNPQNTECGEQLIELATSRPPWPSLRLALTASVFLTRSSLGSCGVSKSTPRDNFRSQLSLQMCQYMTRFVHALFVSGMEDNRPHLRKLEARFAKYETCGDDGRFGPRCKVRNSHCNLQEAHASAPLARTWRKLETSRMACGGHWRGSPKVVRDGICVDQPLCRGTSQGKYGSRSLDLVCAGETVGKLAEVGERELVLVVSVRCGKE